MAPTGHGLQHAQQQLQWIVCQHDWCSEPAVPAVAAAAPALGLPQETYLDDMRDLKRQVYDMFKYHPELLPAVEEGLTKGEAGAGGDGAQLLLLARGGQVVRAVVKTLHSWQRQA